MISLIYNLLLVYCSIGGLISATVLFWIGVPFRWDILVEAVLNILLIILMVLFWPIILPFCI
jgi:hypothetical protein